MTVEKTQMILGSVTVTTKPENTEIIIKSTSGGAEITLDEQALQEISNLFNEMRGVLADEWSIDDVKEVRPDLTDEQAYAVLRYAINENFDSDIGVNWDELRSAANFLYGEMKETE
jgi:hypothetical protein